MPLPPGPRDLFFGLTFYRSMQRDRLGTLQHLARTYGDVSMFAVGPQRLVLLNHPDHVEDVLVTRARFFKKGRALERAKALLGEGLLTSEGTFHLRQRRLAQPAFHRQHVARYADTMVSHAMRHADRWRDGAEIDAAAEMNRLTLMIVAETLFGADVEVEAGAVREALTRVFEVFPITMSPFSPLLERLPLPKLLRYRQAQADLDRIIYGIIEARRSRPADRGDLLSMLLLARDEEGDGGAMTDTQVRDEAMTMFLAGHETTANALAWTWYLLAQHPEIEARLHEEIDAAVGDRAPGPDDVANLPFTRMVLAESMRLFPPAWAIGRRALESLTVGGYTIPQGTVVLVSQYLLQRDPRFYAEPERFDPDRWQPDRQRGRPKFAYFPFGAGTRVCIGEHFAWMEGMLLLATLARRFRLELLEHAVRLQPAITLRPRGGIRMRVLARAGRSGNDGQRHV